MADRDDDREAPTERTEPELTSLESAQIEALLEAGVQPSNEDAEDLQQAIERFVPDTSPSVSGPTPTWRPHFRAVVAHEWRPSDARRKSRKTNAPK